MRFTFNSIVRADRPVRHKSIAHPGRRLFVGVVLGAMAASGCGSGLETANGRSVQMEGGNSVEIAARLADASSVAAAYPAVEMTIIETIGATELVRMEGVMNNASDPADVSGSMSGRYAPPIDEAVRMLLIDGSIYMKSDALGEGWIKVDPDLPSANTYQPQTPTAALDQLRKVGEVIPTGPSEVDGAPVDTYDFTIDMSNVTTELPDGMDPSMLEGMETSGSVSLDADGFARAMTIEVDFVAILKGSGMREADVQRAVAEMGGSVMTVDMTMKPLDAPVEVVTPDPSEVNEFQPQG